MILVLIRQSLGLKQFLLGNRILNCFEGMILILIWQSSGLKHNSMIIAQSLECL